MSQALPYYPPPPAGADQSIINTTPAFKAHILKVTAAVLFFLISYIVLFIMALCLAAASSYLGIRMIVGYPQLITLMLGGGLIGLGLMVIYFLLKFMFKRYKVDRSGFIEITAADQPAVFEFIARISQETQSQFPKRIYLSPDVNASVFYDSSFWSLFLPVKKNLRIGLGLVNVVNISEFKSIIAHEFGHFSQRSMKFGSYIYYVNNIIYNMLYDNAGYDNMIQRWASISQYFRVFALLTVRIVNGIQYLLKQLYIVVNKAYSGLSIQMEYHADSVSAWVSGSDHLITSLKKIEIAQICYANVLNYCNERLAENLRSDNVYPQHNVVIAQFASHFKVPFQDGALQISNDTNLMLNQSRIVVKDQWASHPSTEDREAKLKALALHTPAMEQSAWLLFEHAGQLQVSMTDMIYETVEFKQTPQALNLQNFTEGFIKSISANSYNPAYNSYYDGREMKRFSVDAATGIPAGNQTFEELFSDVNCNLAGKINHLKKDIETLDVIAQKKNKIRSFDFDGVKNSYRNAPAIKAQLEQEVKQAENQLHELDRQAFWFFYTQAGTAARRDELAAAYLQMFDTEEATKQDLLLYNNVMAAMQPVYTHRKFNEIWATMEDVEVHEEKIIPRLQYVLNQQQVYNLNDQQVKSLEDYLQQKQVYFTRPHFNNQAIAVFNKAMAAFVSAVIDKSFSVKRQLFDTQLNLLSD